MNWDYLLKFASERNDQVIKERYESYYGKSFIPSSTTEEMMACFHEIYKATDEFCKIPPISPPSQEQTQNQKIFKLTPFGSQRFSELELLKNIRYENISEGECWVIGLDKKYNGNIGIIGLGTCIAICVFGKRNAIMAHCSGEKGKLLAMLQKINMTLEACHEQVGDLQIVLAGGHTHNLADYLPILGEFKKFGPIVDIRLCLNDSAVIFNPDEQQIHFALQRSLTPKETVKEFFDVWCEDLTPEDVMAIVQGRQPSPAAFSFDISRASNSPAFFFAKSHSSSEDKSEKEDKQETKMDIESDVDVAEQPTKKIKI